MKLPLKNAPVTVTDGYVIQESPAKSEKYSYSISSDSVTANSFKDISITENKFFSNAQSLPIESISATHQNPEIHESITVMTTVTLLTTDGLMRYEIEEGYIYRTDIETKNRESIAACGTAFWMKVDSQAQYNPTTEQYTVTVEFYGLYENDGVWSMGAFDSISGGQTVVVESFSIGVSEKNKFDVLQTITN